MNMKIIKTEQEYAKALERLEVLFDAKRGTKEGDELELLTLLIDIQDWKLGATFDVSQKALGILVTRE